MQMTSAVVISIHRIVFDLLNGKRRTSNASFVVILWIVQIAKNYSSTIFGTVHQSFVKGRSVYVSDTIGALERISKHRRGKLWLPQFFRPSMGLWWKRNKGLQLGRLNSLLNVNSEWSSRTPHLRVIIFVLFAAAPNHFLKAYSVVYFSGYPFSFSVFSTKFNCWSGVFWEHSFHTLENIVRTRLRLWNESEKICVLASPCPFKIDDRRWTEPSCRI